MSLFTKEKRRAEAAAAEEERDKKRSDKLDERQKLQDEQDAKDEEQRLLVFAKATKPYTARLYYTADDKGVCRETATIHSKGKVSSHFTSGFMGGRSNTIWTHTHGERVILDLIQDRPLVVPTHTPGVFINATYVDKVVIKPSEEWEDYDTFKHLLDDLEPNSGPCTLTL